MKTIQADEITKVVSELCKKACYQVTPDMRVAFEKARENEISSIGKGFVIPTAFLLRYGTHEHLTMAFQNYIDRHQLPYVKTNMEKAISLLKENKEVVNNGEKYYAELVVNHNIELKF